MKAAKQNDVNALFNLGVMYNDGNGVTKNKRRPYPGFAKPPEQNDSESQYIVGEIYDEGDGVQVDKKQAAYWYQLAANNGHQQAKKALEK